MGFKKASTASPHRLRERAVNSPSIVRTSFLTYLKTQFPYEHDWVHPTTNVVFCHELIKEVLADYKMIDEAVDGSSYRALWYLWSTQGTRAYIAQCLNYSSPTIKRRWDKSIDTILLMLLYPCLVPQAYSLYLHEGEAR